MDDDDDDHDVWFIRRHLGRVDAMINSARNRGINSDSLLALRADLIRRLHATENLLSARLFGGPLAKGNL